MARLTAGDQPIFRVTVRDQDQAIVDITGATVTLRYSISGAAVIARGMTLIDAPNGIAEYQAVGAELTAGEMRYRFRVVDVGGAQFTSEEEFSIDIRPAL